MTDAATEARVLRENESCLCCCRPLSEHNVKRQCQETTYFIPQAALSTPTPAGELREAVRREVIEECAKVAEGFEDPSRDWVSGSLWDGIKRDTATRIRALAQPGSGEGV